MRYITSNDLHTLLRPLQTFTALRDHPSTNMVVFTTAVEAKDYCERHCVELGEGALKSLLKLDRRRTYVKVGGYYLVPVSEIGGYVQ